MPRRKEPCRRCDSTVAGQHAPQCRYAKPGLNIPVAPPPAPPEAVAAKKTRKRVFTIDHNDGSETTITVVGPAGAVRCSSTEQSVQVWTGETAPQPTTPGAVLASRPSSAPIVAHSTDVARSGQEYTVTDTLDDVPGGNLGLTAEEAANPDAILEKMRLGMIGRMSAETSSSDVLLIPGGSN